MDRTNSFLLAALLSLLAGCASAPRQQAATPSTSATITQTETPSLLGDGGIVEPESRPAISGNKAVLALLDRAQLDSAAGQREAAGASLERALRIEPRNAWLWHELAQLRLAQGQYAQAITLARKSTSFAGRERRLQALNWKVIANARVAQGDTAGAERAFRHAAELEPATEAAGF